MSHFYGTIDGARATQSTRCGNKSGLTTQAAGWKGAVRVNLSHDKATGKDSYCVELIPWKGSGGSVQLIAEGELDSTVPVSK